MAHCRGKHKKRNTCNSLIYRCKRCGSLGCDQDKRAECTSQAFQQGTCVNCAGTEKEPA
jgi:hypothetical protein